MWQRLIRKASMDLKRKCGLIAIPLRVSLRTKNLRDAQNVLPLGKLKFTVTKLHVFKKMQNKTKRMTSINGSA